MPDVALVLMPYASVQRPSAALGTLKACLARVGIAATTIYGNMRFAAVLGLTGYESINTSAIANRIGEWTFAAAAFPDCDLRSRTYLSALSEVLGHPPGLAQQLELVRDLASAFVERMAQDVLDLGPRIVGCSSMFQQHTASLALLRRIRALDPAVVTMLGGGNCEGEMGWTTHQSFDWVDFVVSGEADMLLGPLCRAICEQGRNVPVSALGSGVFGPPHRQADARPTDGELLAPPETALYARVARMDQVPMPDYDDYFAELARIPFRRRVVPGLTVETARGCWWGEKHHCVFCGISDSGMHFRAKPPEQARREMETLRARHGVHRFAPADNIVEPSFFNTLLPALADGRSDFSIFYQTKANLRRRQVATLAEAGVRWIQPGIESLDDRVLSLLRKGATVTVNLQLMKWARNDGIWMLWNLLFGAPGEDDDWYAEMAEWLPLIYHLQPPSGGAMSPIVYNRFSPYFDDQASFGIDLVPFWSEQYTYPLDRRGLARQAYFFLDRRDAGKCIDLAARPGARAMNDRLRDWTAVFVDNDAGPMPTMRTDAPVLAAAPSGDGLTIRDTRPCAIAAQHNLGEREARVYRLCDSATSRAAIAGALARAGDAITLERIDDILGILRRRKLLLDFDGRLLALATDDPPASYPAIVDFPAGLICDAPRPECSVNEKPPSAWDIPLSDYADFFSRTMGKP
jgi:magnesium-protoporphyrin IX monomethyl ester (oxidative) cyclase